VKLKSSVGAMFGMGAVFITGNTIFLWIYLLDVCFPYTHVWFLVLLEPPHARHLVPDGDTIFSYCYV
jgi:hypothetical protein